MTINEKIYKLRKDKGMSQAELAFKTESSIEYIESIDSKGIMVSAYKLLRILNALDITIDEFSKIIIR